MPSKIHVGTAGWSISGHQARFPAGESHLARYSQIFPAVEINTTFYRPHRPATFERWAATVPRAFRFSIKIPREITHDQRLADCSHLLKRFLADVAPLGSKAACLLVQLPPSLAFEARIARGFFNLLRKRFERSIALEPRHASWFTDRVDHFLRDYEVARVAADPSRFAAASEPGGWPGLAYFRLHGSPRTYYSAYAPECLDALAVRLRDLRRRRITSWCIFDNTASGAATGDALKALDLIE